LTYTRQRNADHAEIPFLAASRTWDEHGERYTKLIAAALAGGQALQGEPVAAFERAGDADPAVQEDLRHALYETYERHYFVPGEGDLPFAIGLLLYEMEDYEDALEFFEASLEQHGPDAATEYNIALCESQLD
jgi:tetratricopeptide (TPR) repeat protein